MESIEMAIQIIDDEIQVHRDAIEVLEVKRGQLYRKKQNACDHNWKTYKDISQVSETYCTKCDKVR